MGARRRPRRHRRARARVAICLRFGFSLAASRVRISPWRAAGLAVAARSAPGWITIPLASASTPTGSRRCRAVDAGGVEGGDVPGGVHHGLLDLPLADHRPAAGDRRVRGLEPAARAASSTARRARVRVVPGRWQRQGGIGRERLPAPGRRQRSVSPAPRRAPRGTCHDRLQRVAAIWLLAQHLRSRPASSPLAGRGDRDDPHAAHPARAAGDERRRRAPGAANSAVRAVELSDERAAAGSEGAAP